MMTAAKSPFTSPTDKSGREKNTSELSPQLLAKHKHTRTHIGAHGINFFFEINLLSRARPRARVFIKLLQSI